MLWPASQGTEREERNKHGVTEEEAEEVLFNPGEDRPGDRGSRVAIGQTRAGRYLRIIYVSDPEPDSVFVIEGINHWHASGMNNGYASD